MTAHTIGERARANRVHSAVLLALIVLLLFAAAVAAVGLVWLVVGRPVSWVTGFERPFRDVLMVAAVVALAGAAVALHRARAGGPPDADAPGVRAASPLRDPELLEDLAEVALAAGLPRAPALFIADVVVANAFATGTPTDGAVVLTQGLLKRLDRDEVRAVMAHEVAHIRNGDVRLVALAEQFARLSESLSGVRRVVLLGMSVPQALAQLVPAAVVALIGLGLVALMSAVGDEQSLWAIGVMLVLAVLSVALAVVYLGTLVYAWRALYALFVLSALAVYVPLVGLVANPLVSIGVARLISRKRELLADAEGAKFSGDPQALISALRRLTERPAPAVVLPWSGGRLGLFVPPAATGWAARLNERWLATHPPLKTRIEALARMTGPGAGTVDRTDLETA
jgi:Zn-dependent protease with chaperone function